MNKLITVKDNELLAIKSNDGEIVWQSDNYLIRQTAWSLQKTPRHHDNTKRKPKNSTEKRPKKRHRYLTGLKSVIQVKSGVSKTDFTANVIVKPPVVTYMTATTDQNQVVVAKSDNQSQMYSINDCKSTKSQAELDKAIEVSVALDGSREVKTIDGRIDVLTADHVIEVKEAKNWKHAIGQVIVYGHHYPNKTPVVFIFGENVDLYAERASFHCAKYGILLATNIVELRAIKRR